MSKQLETFKTHLEEFASKHKQEIRKSSQFRVQFQEMCATIGVDPLACMILRPILQHKYLPSSFTTVPMSHCNNNDFLYSTAGKGFWAEMLGVGDFYYELGVQIIEVCLALKHRNGGKYFRSVCCSLPLNGFKQFSQDCT